ncbi:MAG: hypothetical protein BWY61_02099 [Firmicutes bacterium ADurb.Bin354]|nr:MAG: hypothetical protein BWY61_02099 [Firmicutes bacterium ADurb.Bin354]
MSATAIPVSIIINIQVIFPNNTDITYFFIDSLMIFIGILKVIFACILFQFGSIHIIIRNVIIKRFIKFFIYLCSIFITIIQNKFLYVIGFQNSTAIRADNFSAFVFYRAVIKSSDLIDRKPCILKIRSVFDINANPIDAVFNRLHIVSPASADPESLNSGSQIDTGNRSFRIQFFRLTGPAVITVNRIIQYTIFSCIVRHVIK